MYQKYISLLLILITASTTTWSQGRVRAYNRNSIPTPPGMEYIPGGSIMIQYSNESNDSSGYKQVSLSPFFIDKTEVTNAQYREFVNWVIDSIAVTEYLKDEQYFTDRNRDTAHRYIDWDNVGSRRSALWESKDTEIQNRLQGMYQHGKIREELVNYTYTYMKLSDDGRREIYITKTINIYPDKRVWASDFPNSQTDMMVKAYFDNEAYDDYPVVGVTWEQANAYAYWRSHNKERSKKLHKYLVGYDMPYTLPSEAQWAYAATGSMKLEELNQFKIPRNKEGSLEANFKQQEGKYTQDGSSFTMHVMAYKPNVHGLYNMLGNVAEWVLDAYNESAWAFVHDQNPVLEYDAADDEPDVMKRKVVRGGSWKDNAQSLSPHTRGYEVQDVPHSYIGFRCVMPAPEVLTKQVSTGK